MLAVLYGTKHFRPYLHGRRFLLVTDHRALLWLANTPNPPAILARWILRLQEFDFEIQHRPGLQHSNADALSRAPFCNSPTVNAIGVVHILEGFTRDQLSVLQRKDSTLAPFFLFLECNQFPKEAKNRRYVMLLKELLVIENGILWHRQWELITPTVNGPQYQFVVPVGLRTAVLHACHNDRLSGHLGFNKTYSKIKRRFWWPNLYTEVRNYVLGCIPCQRRKNPRQNLKGVLQPADVVRPWQRMSMDLLGPLPPTTLPAGSKLLP